LSTQKNILIAPLDWGLGHATRCMPLIDALIQQQHNIIIAGNGDSYFLLKAQYPDLTSYELPGYNISYPSGKNAAAQAFFQTPKILATIRAEKKITEEIIEKGNISLILSDNRYGVRNEKVKSILICHHIALQAPEGFSFMNPFFLNLHLRQIRKFDALWIPDTAGEPNLSGKLAHGIQFPIPHHYIGIQSRFSDFKPSPSFTEELDFSVLVVLSGPEPQRTYAEEKLIAALKNRNEKVLFARGRTAVQQVHTDENITIVNYLGTNDMFVALNKAEVIICRSGYSTVMDLTVLGKQAIFIPAEGQTEQEYLAKRAEENGFGVNCPQDKLDLNSALEKFSRLKGFNAFSSTGELNSVLKQLFI
jgi:UDP:flavonoid glycosyltransferase YjiC (YdhE family)